MRTFLTIALFLTLVHAFASIIEVPASTYAESIEAYCKGDICK